MMIVKGGVTAPAGFLANALKASLKKSGRTDLALLYSEVPAVAAAAFTTNRFQASPVRISKAHIKNKIHQALIVNSGNANCANGKTGDKNASLVASLLAKSVGLMRREVLVASTGIIGHPLPIEKIKRKIPVLVEGLHRGGGSDFAEAIMTTDTKKKECAVKVKIGRSVVTIGGAAKGVGMIYPDIAVEKHATMLCFMTTDASISKRMLEDALAEAVGESFNMVSVDGDMSTNDSCFILANGLAGNERIAAKDRRYCQFTGALRLLACELAKMLARDGEGATKFIEIKVEGAKTKEDAAKIARKISTSNLLKCCVYGGDPNWGRIAASLGSSGVDFDPDKADIYLGGVKVFARGAKIAYDNGRAISAFRARDVSIKVDLKSGGCAAAAWTCDFSKEYVEINSEYST